MVTFFQESHCGIFGLRSGFESQTCQAGAIADELDFHAAVLLKARSGNSAGAWKAAAIQSAPCGVRRDWPTFFGIDLGSLLRG
jgi:hypothetical protein